MPSSQPYPLFLNLHRRPVLIVGGGAVALRKATGLLVTGAQVTVVSPQFAPAFSTLKHVDRIQASYAAAHMALKRWRLVFAATDTPEVNAQVHTHAAAAGIFCCRCDKPDDGDFSSGATRRLGDEPAAVAPNTAHHVVLAVSTSAASPALAARICKQAAGGVDAALLKLAGLLGEWRPMVKAQVAAGPIRTQLLRKIAGDAMEEALRTGGEPAARKKFSRWLAEAQRPTRPAPQKTAEPQAGRHSRTGQAKHVH